MSKGTRARTRPGNDYKSRILLDFFMFSTLINGFVCGSTQNHSSNEMKLLNEKRPDVSEKCVHQVVVSRGRSYLNHDGNSLANFAFDKMLNWIFDNEVEKGDRSSESRTIRFGQRFGHRFVGHRKRLQFALLPIMYKMGVMTTLLTGLTVLALKGLTIGVILLIFAFGNHFLKISKQWHWQPYQQPYQPIQPYQPLQPSQQPIHLHLHSLAKPNKYIKYHSYGENEIDAGPWDRNDVQGQYVNPYAGDDSDSYRRSSSQSSRGSFNFLPN